MSAGNDFGGLVYCTWTQRANFPDHLRRKFGDLDEYIRRLLGSSKTSLTLVAPFLSRRWMDAYRGSLELSATRGAFIRLLSRDLNDTSGVNGSAVRTLIKNGNSVVLRNRIRFLEANADLSEFVHAKLIIADRARGYIGSANFSERAMGANFEIGSALNQRQCEALDDLIDYLESSGSLIDITNKVMVSS